MCVCRTLAECRANCQRQRGRIAELGYGESFRRLWDFYLSYCEAGFRTGRTDVVQLGLSKA